MYFLRRIKTLLRVSLSSLASNMHLRTATRTTRLYWRGGGLLHKYFWKRAFSRKFIPVIVMALLLLGPGAGGREAEADPDIARAKAMVQSIRDAYNSVSFTFAEQAAKHSYSLEQEVVPFLMSFVPEFTGIAEKIMDVAVSLGPGQYRELPLEERPGCPNDFDNEDVHDGEPEPFDTCVTDRKQNYERLGDADGWIIFGADGKTYTAHWERIVDTAMLELNVTDTAGVVNINRGTNHRIVATLLNIDSNDFPGGLIVDGAITNKHISVSLHGTVHYGEFLDALLGLAPSSSLKAAIRSDIMTVNMEAGATAQRMADGFGDTVEVVVKQSGAIEIQFPTFSIQNSLAGTLTLYPKHDVEMAHDEIESLFTGLSEVELFDLNEQLPYGIIFNSFAVESAFADRDDRPTRIEGLIGADFGPDGFNIFADLMSLVFDGIIPEMTFTVGGSVYSPRSGSAELQLTLNMSHPDRLSGEIVFNAPEELLTGTYVIPFDDLAVVTVHLENQHGIEARLAFPPEGTPFMEITKGDKSLGELIEGRFIDYIMYADGTVESVF